jgi:pimeloyl-ACP methyl ester carboxylesterase
MEKPLEIVLVHGAWHGAWCWRHVLPALIRAGHRVHAVTHTGVGERAHLLHRGITLSSHIQDVCALIEAEELHAPVLVGHSYGGMVITGVADRLLAARAAGAQTSVRRLVYIDAIVPLPGESWSSTQTEQTRAARIQAGQADPLNGMPPPPASAFGLSGEDAAWADRRQTPQPLGTYTEPLDFDLQRLQSLHRHFIDCVAPASLGIAGIRSRIRDPNFWGGAWKITELQTGHDAMLSAPDDLVRCILD